MSAEYYTSANRKTDDDSVLLSVSFAQSAITCMGTSCPASVGAMTGGLTSFTVVPQKGKRGVVAIRLFRESAGRYEPDEDLFFLLPVEYDTQPFVDRKNPLIPSADRLAQLTRDGLFVTAGDQKFAALNTAYHKSSSAAEIKMAWAKQGIRIVPDANLLCRFLVDEATLEQVEATAEAFQEEETWPAKYAALEVQLQAGKTECDKLNKFLKRAREDRSYFLDGQLEKTRTLWKIGIMARNAHFGSRGLALKKIIELCAEESSEPPKN